MSYSDCDDDRPVEGEKFYSAVDDLEIDFAAKLADGETISSPAAAVVAASNGVVGDLTLGSPTVSGTKVIVRATGGKCGTQIDTYRWETDYLIRITATSSSGETPAGLIKLTVYDVIERA